MPLPDRSLQTHFQSSRLSQPLQRDRSHLQDPVVRQSCWAHNPRKVGVIVHQDCRSCSKIPFLDFDTAGSEWINRRMNRQQARPCMCAWTKQTMRFCTRHGGKTPTACSLEPRAACAHNSSVATEQRHREKEQHNSSCHHVLEKARVCTSHPLIATSTDVALLGRQRWRII